MAGLFFGSINFHPLRHHIISTISPAPSSKSHTTQNPQKHNSRYGLYDIVLQLLNHPPMSIQSPNPHIKPFAHIMLPPSPTKKLIQYARMLFHRYWKAWLAQPRAPRWWILWDWLRGKRDYLLMQWNGMILDWGNALLRRLISMLYISFEMQEYYLLWRRRI